MKFLERTENIEIKGEYDVIVAGSGPSGIAAAVCAAREGAHTLIIESCGSVGGISTTGLMSHFTGSVVSKTYFEILKRMGDKNTFDNGKVKVEIDPELLKNVYYEMLNEAGVDILLYTMVCDTITENNTVKGVICQNKSGRGIYMSKIVIDCTGDGDVAYYAGAQYFKGRESDSLMQPATLMFKVGGVDMARAVFPPSFETTVETPKGELQQLAKEKLPKPAGHVLLYKSTIPGIVTCNMTNVTGIDGTKAEDLTKAELVCRSQMEPIVEFLRQYVPGYENCYIISAASLIGIRETRHFKGIETITEEDVLSARKFDNWVVRDAWFNFDVHNMTGSGLDKTGSQKTFKQTKGYTIPFGCIIPEKIDGLILSGRNISGTHMAHSNFRVMPICVAIGEAGGMTAALAVKHGCKPRDVNVEEIQKKLI
jgi:hypothetical protein